MNIIKNLIKLNQLRDELHKIEHQLLDTGYYEKEKILCLLIRKPDQYAELYMEIDKQYGDLVRRRNQINRILNKLSGINLFKKQDDELIK